MILIALKMNGQDIDWERKNCSGHWLHLSTAQRTRRCTSMRELKSAEQTCVKRSTESSIPHFCSISLETILGTEGQGYEDVMSLQREGLRITARAPVSPTDGPPSSASASLPP